MTSYRKVASWLVPGHEQFIVKSASAIVLTQLPPIDLPAIDFMVPCDEADADVYFDTEVGGLCGHNGRQIYLQRDLPVSFLAKAVAHELRHAFQQQKKLKLSRVSAERDAEIFSWEFWVQIGCPSDAQLIRALANANEKLPATIKCDKRRGNFL